MVTQNLSRPRLDVFCDATWKRGVSVIGYVSRSMNVSNTKVIKARDINDAELKAVELVMSELGNRFDLQIYTDSSYAVREMNSDQVNHIPRSQNIANMLVRSLHETLHRQ